VSLDERPRGSTRPTPKVHHNSLPKTSIEGALGPFTAARLQPDGREKISGKGKILTNYRWEDRA
jgi:hypothetical protein